MKTVLSTFTRHEDARAAAERLRTQGLALDDVSVHQRPPLHDPSSASRIDELVSGGIFTDFYALLENLFGPGSGTVTRNLADGIPAGGSVVVVRARTDDDAARAQALLLDAGALGQYAVPREGDLD
jgi:hypothetical protein